MATTANLGPETLHINPLWRGDTRTLVLWPEVITQAWIDANPNPTDDELAAADLEPMDLTGYTAAAHICDAEEDGTVIFEADVVIDEAESSITVTFDTPADLVEESWWDLELMPPGGGRPYTMVAGKITAKGQRTIVA